MNSRESKRIGLGAEGEELFDLLLSALKAGEGFELFFVCSASRYVLNEILQRLSGSPIAGITPQSFEYSHPEDLGRLLEDLFALPRLKDGRYVICVSSQGTEDELLAAWTRALILLNEQRNRLIAQCPSAILLMGPPSLSLVAQNRAPDLWSVRSFVFLVPESIEKTGNELLTSSPMPWNKDLMAHELHEGEYYAGLAKALEGSRRGAERISRANLLLRAADAWKLRGEIDKAMQALKEAELLYQSQGHELGASKAMRNQCYLLFHQGNLDQSLEILNNQVLPAFERLGDEYERAETADLIADILFARGELDEALRIRKEELVPVCEKLGDVRSRAITLGKIADVLFARGELDEAFRLQKEEVLPVYEKLGEVRERAVTLGKIADILYRRGELDEALRIQKEEVLPVYEKLGDVRDRAITLGKIANILFARGELDEALRIRVEEELPVYEKLGDVRDLLVGRANIALILLERNAPGDREEAKRLLHLALDAARRLRIPEAAQIESLLKTIE